ncbi:hypothetical protein HDU83_005312 [Entophlyctis luteolus]|nr:hypothetical protein HDU83_005312 [Entophlyctis luteolus]
MAQFPALSAAMRSRSRVSGGPSSANLRRELGSVPKFPVPSSATPAPTPSAVEAKLEKALRAKFRLPSVPRLSAPASATAIPDATEVQQDGQSDDEHSDNFFDDGDDLMQLAMNDEALSYSDAETDSAETEVDETIDDILRRGNELKTNLQAASRSSASGTRKKLVVNNSAAVVVSAVDTVGRKAHDAIWAGGTREWRAFMASDVSKMNPKPSKVESSRTKEEREQDKDDDAKDKELMDLLRTSKLIEEFNDEQLFGKDRRKRFEEKLFDLGAKKPSAPKVPFPMRLASIDTKKRRATARLAAAKETGDFHGSLKTSIKAGGDKELAKQLAAKSKPRKRRTRDIDEGNGRFKDGTLHINKNAAAAVAKMGDSGAKRGRNVGMGIRITGATDGAVAKKKKKGGKKLKKKR